MTTIYLDSLSNDRYNERQLFSPSDQHHEHQFLSPNSQALPASNSLTCHLFFNPISTTHDQDRVFDKESHPSPNEDDSFGSRAYDDHGVEDQDEDERVEDNDGLKLSLWKKETYDDDDGHVNDDSYQLKWMSSKMRVMLKMKKKTKLGEDHKEPTSSPMDEITYSNTMNTTTTTTTTSSNNNLIIPIRVCSDCNTTKTPLWRSGPQGPKSLCNACGIRQRKARKAMAAAAAAAAETGETTLSAKPTSVKATKMLNKDYNKKPNNGISTKYKKKQYSKQRDTTVLRAYSSSPAARKNRVEEFLVRLSNNLAFQCVFPQDEKEAAILLMALSCGYVHQ